MEADVVEAQRDVIGSNLKKEAEDFMVKKNPPQKAGDNDNEIKILVTINGTKVTAKLV
tara:strand:+ start:17173 stop:17346 length:174 start_codon:yes stop_codon:yes gene_type:complete